MGHRCRRHRATVTPLGVPTGFKEVKVQGATEFGRIVSGMFMPVLAKHSKAFSLIDRISMGVNRMQCNFEPMRKQVEWWQRSDLTGR